VLVELARQDAENITVRTQLAQMALARDDFAAARTWAREMLFVDVESAEGHLLLAKAWAGLKDAARAREEFERTLTFDEESLEARLGLARCAQAAGDLAAAQQAVAEVLAKSPDHPEALELQAELQRGRCCDDGARR
jgi:Tfp pilus assembly protein PilF